MAEGGEEENNPFSFKKFVKSKDKNVEKGEEENTAPREETVAQTKDIRAFTAYIHGKKKGMVAHNLENTSSNTKKKKKPDENPFRLKVLESSGSGSNSRERNNKIHHSQRNSQNTPDFATDLPDFVQDHFQESPVEPSLPTSLDLPLPDLGFPKESISRRHTNSFNEQFSTGSNDARNFSTDSLRAKGVFTPNNSASDLVSGIGEVTQNKSEEQDFMPNRPHVPTRLPDFITDGIFKNTDSVPDNEISLPKPEGYLPNGPQRTRSKDAENERLKAENEILKQQLEEAKSRNVIETKRCNKLKKEMEAAQKKEAEDTAAMEKMLGEVEANLLTTTKRAVAAENQLTVLQNRVTFLENENRLLKSGDKGLADLKERTSYVSQQLSSVVSAAEQNLKQMLSGVENLRVMSQVLKSIDKVTETEESTGASQKPDPKNNS